MPVRAVPWSTTGVGTGGSRPDGDVVSAPHPESGPAARPAEPAPPAHWIRRLRVSASVVVGMALGSAVTVGTALLLYTGRRVLPTSGFLVALAVGALGAGTWVGGADQGRTPRSRSRWVAAMVALALAAALAAARNAYPSLRTGQAGGALGVLLLLAVPAYVTGSLISVLQARETAAGRSAGAIGIAVLLGACLGILGAATVFIPNFDAPGVLLVAATVLALAGSWESGLATTVSESERANMKNRVVIVTGVGRRGQVGYVIAQRFLAGGARVVITGRTAAVDELAAELAAHGEVAAVAADLTEAGDIERVVAAARDRWGRLDALINVAGGLSVNRPVEDTEPEDWRREIERSAETALRMIRATLPLLRAHRGAIVNFAAPAGERARARLAAYSAAKAAVIALTRAVALEEREHGVRCNAIAPGLVDTAQNREWVKDAATTHWVTREQIADVAFFLAGSAASGISGEVLHVLGDTLK